MRFLTSILPLRRTGLAAFVAALCLAPGAAAQPAQDDAQAPAPPEGSVGGMGDINLFPKRVVIEGRRQIATIGLYNKTANDGDYEIKLVDMGMTPEGQLLNFDNGLSEDIKANVKTASPFLRYSPRRVTLRGSESQTIRIMARGGSDLPPGEYRSHFLAVSVPPVEDAASSIDNAINGTSADGIGVSIKPRFGISIPVIVRIGDTTLDVGIREAALLTAQDGSQAVGIILTRSGTRSAFGDIVVTTPGSDEPVAIARGVGIYPEVGERKIILPVNPELEPGILTSGKTLSIRYTDDDFEPGAQLAEHTITIP